MKVRIYETCGQYFVYDEDHVLIAHTKYWYILWLGIWANNWTVIKDKKEEKQ